MTDRNAQNDAQLAHYVEIFAERAGNDGSGWLGPVRQEALIALRFASSGKKADAKLVDALVKGRQ